MQSRNASHCALAGLLIAAVAVVVGAMWSVKSAAEVRFDHLTTGFRLEGAHRSADCEGCHSDGVFAGTPTDCVDCHAQASRIRATWKPQTHLQTTDRCDGCHRPFAWAPILRFDHLESFYLDFMRYMSDAQKSELYTAGFRDQTRSESGVPR